MVKIVFEPVKSVVSKGRMRAISSTPAAILVTVGGTAIVFAVLVWMASGAYCIGRIMIAVIGVGIGGPISVFLGTRIKPARMAARSAVSVAGLSVTLVGAAALGFLAAASIPTVSVVTNIPSLGLIGAIVAAVVALIPWGWARKVAWLIP